MPRRIDRSPGSLINKTPVEVLCKIFSQVLDPSSFPSVPSHLIPHQKNSELLRITAVCMHWRSTALEHAVFWTTITFSTSRQPAIQCAKLFLSRSKAAMLSVHIWDSGNAGDSGTARASRELLELVAGQVHRISTCVLSSSSPGFWRYWAHPAPNLRRLIVTTEQGAEVPSIFNGEIPQLEAFTARCHAPWPLGNYASLREANLRNNNRTVTLPSLLDGLRGCKKLESLSLHGYTPLGRIDPPPATVSLPRLRKLDIFSSNSTLILEHLDSPSLTGPVIIFDTKPHHHILCPLPRTLLSPPYLQGISKLHVVLNTPLAQHYVVGFRESGDTAFYIGACGVGYWLSEPWVEASIEAVAVYARFFQIKSLVFATDVPEVPWDLWLPNLDSVRELCVACPRPGDLLAALTAHSAQDGLPLCPSLHSIALQRCGKYAVVDQVRLMKLVLSRYRAGSPIRKLKLQKDEWDWIKQLNGSWRRLIRSQVIDGDNVSLDLVPEAGLGDVEESFYMYEGRP